MARSVRINRKNISQSKRIVIKIGSSLLTQEGKTNYKKIKKYSQLIHKMMKLKKEVVLVTSGAVAASGHKQTLKHPLAIKQILASMGQVNLMSMYSKAFKSLNLNIGQILLSEFSISNRVSYLNARSTINAMIALNIVPIINENDALATEELKFGDNDVLGSLVAGLIDADLYIILSDVKGFYSDYNSDNPILHTHVDNITKKHLVEAKGASTVGTGGMYTKLLAAKKCGEFSIPTLIIDGNKKHLYYSIFEQEIGTFFSHGIPNYDNKKIRSRKKWIGSQIRSKGIIHIDPGAEKALTVNKASLLAKGIVNVVGKFEIGDICSIVNKNNEIIAKGLVNFNSTDLQKIKGQSTQFIKEELGETVKIPVIHVNNLFLSTL